MKTPAATLASSDFIAPQLAVLTLFLKEWTGVDAQHVGTAKLIFFLFRVLYLLNFTVANLLIPLCTLYPVT